MSEKQERIEELVGLIRYHNEKYENGEQEISDPDFDALTSELEELDPENPVLFELTGFNSGHKTIEHPEIMGSLKKVYSAEEVREWAKAYPNCDIIVSMKLDGLAMRLVYENGELVLAATRGRGGMTGKDVTENVRAGIKGAPAHLGELFTGELRGEIYWTKREYKRHLDNGGKSFANLRNAAAGTLGLLDHEEVAKRKLTFSAYEVRNVDGHEFEKETDKRDFVNRIGGNYVSIIKVDMDRLDALIEASSKERDGLNFDIDGLVFSINESSLIEEEGMISGRLPKAKRAYKYPAEQKKTKLIAIANQVGRTGKMTPVGLLEPVELAGSIVQRVTLHNLSQMRAKNVSIGAEIVLEKSGDIIPYLVEVSVPGNGDINYPEFCPSCGEKTIEDDNQISVMCVNPTCPAQAITKILHWTRTIDAKGIGVGNIAKMIETEMISGIVDLYSLDVDKVADLTGGKRSAQKIINAIESRLVVPVNTFLAALGIHHFGNTMAKTIVKEHKTLETIRNLTADDFKAMDGIGEITSNIFANGLANMSHTIDALLEHITVEDVVEIDGPLKGKSFCLTGSFSKNKKEYHNEIEALGGEVYTSVKKGLSYLAQSDPTSHSSKTKKVAKLNESSDENIEIIGEEQLQDILNG